MDAFALLVAVGLASAPYTGSCYSHGDEPAVHCSYKATPVDLTDAIRVAVGRKLMLGPWADELPDLRNPALIALAGETTVIINADLGGPAMVNISTRHALMSNVTINPPTGDAVVGVEFLYGRPDRETPWRNSTPIKTPDNECWIAAPRC